MTVEYRVGWFVAPNDCTQWLNDRAAEGWTLHSVSARAGSEEYDAGLYMVMTRNTMTPGGT